MTLLVILVGVGIALLLCWLDEYSPARRKERLLDDLHRADRAIEAQFRQARRQMNDAAGQSWRNQFE